MIVGSDNNDFLVAARNLHTPVGENNTNNPSSEDIDKYYGLGGDDRLFGDNSSEEFYGGEGNDEIMPTVSGSNSSEVDIIDGGPGYDILTWSQTPINIDLSNSGEQKVGEATLIITNIEKINGSNYNDTVMGDEGDNGISLHDGDDRLYGFGGNDELRGVMATTI